MTDAEKLDASEIKSIELHDDDDVDDEPDNGNDNGDNNFRLMYSIHCIHCIHRNFWYLLFGMDFYQILKLPDRMILDIFGIDLV